MVVATAGSSVLAIADTSNSGRVAMKSDGSGGDRKMILSRLTATSVPGDGDSAWRR